MNVKSKKVGRVSTQRCRISVLWPGLLLASSLAAGPKPDQLERLGQELTPVGAERAGNADGSIPPWTGGIAEPPAGYLAGDRHSDPFAADAPLYQVTAANMAGYRAWLSPGQQAMLARYPDSYYLTVYPSRRSAAFPERIYRMTAENGRTGRLTEQGEGVAGVAEGFPFPFPENALELIWNHKLKYKGTGSVRQRNLVAPTAGGAYTLIRVRTETLGRYFQPGATLESIDNILLYLRQEILSPARLAGTRLLVHESLNQALQPRQAWTYNPGRRRVLRAPNVAYDHSSTATDGLAVSDMLDMFNGATDRFDWRLAGRRELLVPYNAYRAHSDQLTYDELVQAGHLNPKHMRYERHRVWVVEATLKDGTRHIHPRRTYYLDEDSYQVVLIDHYDAADQIWRFSEAHAINYYEVPTFWSTIEVHHDLVARRYAAYGLDNQDQVAGFDRQLSPANFRPQALRSR